MKKSLVVVLALVLSLAFAGFAFAGSASSPSQLNFNYAGDCTIVSDPSTTFQYDRVTGASGNLNVTANCSLMLPYHVTIDGGKQAANGARVAINGTSNLVYHLYNDAADASEITVATPGNEMMAFSKVGTGVVEPQTLYVKAVAADNASSTIAVGVYTDTIGITVAY